ncbi:hypothetical protein [Streptomyces melanogenes]|uniref:hypothetical protein n=1 Tax=Streptomyces melanogenes TaxID=67326 RepID=UPI0037A55B4D
MELPHPAGSWERADAMQYGCPGCDALRAEARRPGADLADLLHRVQLHELDPHPSPAATPPKEERGRTRRP